MISYDNLKRKTTDEVEKIYVKESRKYREKVLSHHTL